MTERKCRDCRFWNKAKRATWSDVGSSGSILVEHAQCRKYAPQRMAADHRSPVPDKVWPHVNATDWCGEWEQADG